MKKIIVGGQLNTDKICSYINKKYGGVVYAYSKVDCLDGILDLQNGIADYYIGFCLTGSGGSIVIPRSQLGQDACFIVSTPSNISDVKEIKKALRQNKKIYGFYIYSYKKSLKKFIECILEV